MNYCQPEKALIAGPKRITGSTVIADLIPPLHSRQLERRWIGSLLLKKDARFMDQTAEEGMVVSGDLYFLFLPDRTD